MIKTLLLNNNYQIIAFITERKAIKLILKDKVDILSHWDGMKIPFINGYINYPATLRMKYYIKLKATKLNFSRKLVLRRDKYTCCYCGQIYSSNKLTIDHIIPKSAGGVNSFTNCVTACLLCNRKKANKTLEEVGMRLLHPPTAPNKYLCYIPLDIKWHSDWLYYI